LTIISFITALEGWVAYSVHEIRQGGHHVGHRLTF